LLAMMANVLIYFIGNPTLQISTLPLTVYDWLVSLVILILFSIAITTTWTQARLLAQADEERRERPADMPGGESLRR
jgi:hypothetical protein